MKLKVGDRVKILAKNKYPDLGDADDHIGQVGYVKTVYPEYYAIWESLDNHYWGLYDEAEVKLIGNKNHDFSEDLYTHLKENLI